MKNLLQFFYIYRGFFIFILLETFCFYQIVNSKSYHQASYLNASHSATSSVQLLFNNLFQYFRLSDVNQDLAQENADLRRYLSAFLSIDEMPESVLKDSILLNKYVVVPARVINNPVNLIDNHFTMNRGTKHGVKNNMGVITHKGVVGVIKAVSDNFCVARSLMNTQQEISAKIKGHNQFGMIRWDGNNINETQLLNIANHISVKRGDTVKTSGSSSIFPENTIIGTIIDVQSISGKAFYEIQVALINDMQQLQYVYLIENKFKNEQKEIEKGFFGDE